MVPAALGTDGAGSLRIPAALDGICAIKPTYGAVPNSGDIPMMPSFSHIGPMARSVADCAAVLAALVGRDLPTAARPAPHPLAGLRIALTDRPEAFDVHPDVAHGFDAARAACERLGAEVVALRAAPGPTPEDAVTLVFGEAWPYFSRHAGREDLYRTSIAEFADLARRTHDPAAQAQATKRRDAIREGWRAWFAEHRVDAILEPTCVMPAPERGHGYDSGHLGGEGDPLIVLTSTWNFTGFPAVALPSGVGRRSGLPVGVSLVGLPDTEPALVQAAIDLQEHGLPPISPPV
jgi:aspartyl-tRNA(Asn)/glutamyl-tRNA(Gln) amidotransferase subunit A